MDIGLYSIFFVTTVMLIMVPGPSAITVAAQGASNTASRALMGVLGVASADAIFFLLSATGIASLIVASSVLFNIIKWVGVIYLLYLGITALFSKSGAIRIHEAPVSSSSLKLYRQGLVVQLSNPKALMYFSALLPQFIDPSKPIALQLFVMGITGVVADILVYSVFSHMGAQLAKQRMKAWVVNLINKAAGITLVVTGIRMALLKGTQS